MNDYVAGAGHELDLRGFSRRVPRAAVAWHLSRLGPGASMGIVFEPTTDRDRLLSAIRACGGVIVGDEVPGESRQRVTVRNGGTRRVGARLDMRGIACPLPIVEARRRLRALGREEVLELVSDCTSAPGEVMAWLARSSDLALLGHFREGGADVFVVGYL